MSSGFSRHEVEDGKTSILRGRKCAGLTSSKSCTSSSSSRRRSGRPTVEAAKESEKKKRQRKSNARKNEKKDASEGGGGPGTVKVICSDVDGTLVNSDGSLPLKTEECVRKAKAMDVPVMIATGKTRGPWAERVYSQLDQDPKIPGVFVQGTVICDGLGNVLESTTLPKVAVEAICGYCRIRGISVVAFCEKKIFCERRDAQTDSVIQYGESEPECVPTLSFHRRKKPNKMILFWDEETNGSRYKTFEQFRAEAERALGSYEVDVTVAVDGMLEFLPKGASKGAAVKRACEKILNVKMENVLAIGDAENDLDMLQMAGASVAVANAKENVKKVAMYTTKATNEEGAVGEAIEKFVFTAEENEEKKEEKDVPSQAAAKPPAAPPALVATNNIKSSSSSKLMKPSMTTEKSGELKVVTKETTEFAKANLSETIAKVKAKIEKFDKKEFEEKVMKNVVAPVVKSVRAAQGGGNAELAQRRAKMDAENAKRLSDESKSDDASAAKKKIAAKAAVRAAKSASKAVILEAEAISSRMSECESKELELKAAELSERLAQLQRGMEIEERKLAEAERLATASNTPTPPLPRAPPSPSSSPPSESAATTPSSALIEPVLEEPEFSLPVATPKKAPPVVEVAKSYNSVTASSKKTEIEKKAVVTEKEKKEKEANDVKEKNSEEIRTWKEPGVSAFEPSSLSSSGNWRDTKTEDNSIAWDDKKGQQQQQQQQQQESQEQQNKKTSSPRSENDNNLLAAFAASALKTVQTLTSPEAKRMQRNAKIAALKAEVIKKALNLDSGRNGDVTDEQLEDFKVTLRKLEAMNNTKMPTRSTLINGKWSLAFTNDTDLLRVGKRRGLFGTRNKRSEGTIDFSVDVFANDNDVVEIEEAKKPKNKMRYEILRSWPQSSENGELHVLSTNEISLAPPKAKLFGFIPIGGGKKKRKSAKSDEGVAADANADDLDAFDDGELATYQSLVVSYLDLEMLSFRSAIDDCVYVFLQQDVDYRVGGKNVSVSKQLTSS